MVFPWQRDDTDLPAGSDERLEAAACPREGLPAGHGIDGFGEYDEDYPTPPTQTDVHCSSREEVLDYYDSVRPEDITIKSPPT